MPFDFDREIGRAGTASAKWDPAVLREKFGADDMLSYWVADMDFEVAPAIREAVVGRAEHAIYGYTTSDGLPEALCSWLSRRHGWDADPSWVVTTPGVVCALHAAVQAFTMPGDSVIIQRPVYYPFSAAVERNGRHVSCNALVQGPNGYEMDFEDLERRCADPRATMLVLCSPHNPVGRVWTDEELRRLMGICLANDVLVVADEIHNDLVMPGYTHHVLASLDDAYADHVVTCVAPSKTFNLAGMQLSGVLVPNDGLRRRLLGVLERLAVGSSPNPLARAAALAAWDKGEPWLDELLVYLRDNVEYLQERCARDLSGVRFFEHQGTYLVWMDFRQYGLSDAQLHELLWRRARVAMDGGSWFGPEGKGFMRMNVACPRSLLGRGVDRMARAVEEAGLDACGS